MGHELKVSSLSCILPVFQCFSWTRVTKPQHGIPGVASSVVNVGEHHPSTSADENHPNVWCSLHSLTESTQLADVQPDANRNCPLIMAATQPVISQIALVDWLGPPGHRDFCFPLLKTVWSLLASFQSPFELRLYNALSSQFLPFFHLLCIVI